ncbi:MFS transporter [uncultured Jatrophihabitans sp.]|uniref:MFS transporter n=1 Tax=uncultured Jatrophihabitans sp. TaxID=1610747 RepID=UPI0035CA071F
MGKRKDERPHGRFGRSGHTTHHISGYPDASPRPGFDPDRAQDFRSDDTEAHVRPPTHTREYEVLRGDDRYGYREDRYRDERPYRDDRYGYRDERPYRDDRYGYRDERPYRDDRYGYESHGYPPPPGSPPPGADPYSDSTYHTGTAVDPQSTPTVGRAALHLGKATARGTNRAARTVTRKVISLSEADGAKESGLTALIWNQVLSYGTDAMITVALAGTVFFGASADAQRGNVLLYLLVTMAPFAVVAPVIGPALDRLQHGRRWTMAGTAIGRAVLALIMAMHPTDLLVLYPCALGSLVLSKAYGVLRAAAAPRLVPAGMTLTAANAKLTIFGLGSTIVLGGLVGAIINLTGSYSVGLVVTAVGFSACAFFAFQLPKQVDSAQPAPRHPEEPVRPKRQDKVPPLARIQQWARRGFGAHLVIALQGQSVLRLLSGMLTIYLAFYVEGTKHGLAGVVELGGVVGAAGFGNFLGIAIGTRLRMAKPESLIVVSTVIGFATLLVSALIFSILVAIVAMLVISALNSLSKIALDSLIQNDVIETLRSSAFGKSETFLQLAWVIGAAIGVALPSSDSGDGTIAFVVAAVITGAVAALVVLRTRASTRQRTGPRLDNASGAGLPRSLD